ncbi:MAG: chorismate lyase [Neisseria sp.]|nr:chorismate lyase [Neisseria sp.]
MNPHHLSAKPHRDTLLYATSLTAELKKQAASFTVRLNFLGLSHLDADEVPFFTPLRAGDEVFVREVCLCLDHIPVVSARSVCLPHDTYWRQTLDCGVQSLGGRLFGGSMDHLQRSPFAFTDLPPEHRLVAGFATTNRPSRRSVFSAEDGDLLLIECFLPELKRYYA